MSLLEMFITAVALSADAFGVSVAIGGLTKGFKFNLKLSVMFGATHFFMALIGAFVGSKVAHVVMDWSRFAAFAFLMLLSLKLFYEAVRGTNPEEVKIDLSMPGIVALSIAVSIDALSAGTGLGLVGAGVLKPSIIIATVVSFITFITLSASHKLSQTLGRLALASGAVLLAVVAVRILLG